MSSLEREKSYVLKIEIINKIRQQTDISKPAHQFCSIKYMYLYENGVWQNKSIWIRRDRWPKNSIWNLNENYTNAITALNVHLYFQKYIEIKIQFIYP